MVHRPELDKINDNMMIMNTPWVNELYEIVKPSKKWNIFIIRAKFVNNYLPKKFRNDRPPISDLYDKRTK